MSGELVPWNPFSEKPKRDLTTEFLKRLPASALYPSLKEMGVDTYIGHDAAGHWFTYLAGRDHYRRTMGTGERSQFSYIQFSQDHFKRLMLEAMVGAHSFIDVGCGGGDKLAIIKENWPHCLVHGVEHDPAMAIWASLFADRVYCQDARELDYSVYDVIYAYWPISHTPAMNQLMQQIMDTKKESAKFVLVGYHNQDVGRTWHPKGPEPELYNLDREAS